MIPPAVRSVSENDCSRAFFEKELGLSLGSYGHADPSPETLQHWLKTLSPCQQSVLSHLCCSYATSDLFPYFWVDQFSKRVLAVTVTEVAQRTCTSAQMDPCWIKDNKYDKKALLFILFTIEPALLKRVYFLDKCHRQSFTAFELETPVKQKGIAFKAFIEKACRTTTFCAQESIETYNAGERLYLFKRYVPAHQPAVGGQNQCMILDFSVDGYQVNISTQQVQEGVAVAQQLLSQYYDSPCTFKVRQAPNQIASVRTLLKRCLAQEDPQLALYQLTFCSPQLQHNADITLTIHPSVSMCVMLQALQPVVGDIVQVIDGIKKICVVFAQKQISIFLRIDPKNTERMGLYYADDVLDTTSRHAFIVWMKDTYDLTLLPYATDWFSAGHDGGSGGR